MSETAMEGSHPAQPAEPGTLKASLLDTPDIDNMTEKESAHPLSSPDVEVNKSITKEEIVSNDKNFESKFESIIPVSIEYHMIKYIHFTFL
jgi:hypothetical protein